MRLIWNGHSCFTLETAGGTVVVDPYLDGSVPGLAPIRLRADAVYCSHDHRDHGARELVALTGEKPDVAVETIHTWHDDQQGAQRGSNTIHIFQAEGLRVAHLGDLGCELEPEQLEALKGLDALMIPHAWIFDFTLQNESDLFLHLLRDALWATKFFRHNKFSRQKRGLSPFLKLLPGGASLTRPTLITLQLTKITRWYAEFR